ncbi:Oidioi.mRNA.OKI2018_I69.XSR.g15765.t3.cds [Oikopleura dioica]|uniref:Oidioi.mRNA.OKI2018_I69.XSR.g15765.t3.cds n=1 Tax=Oikopleura dioica TaxID=34765 RepID=A0ABN7SDW1_OIKDI|nr:Oidioi.mRNA.OKI2018_I69.XSR.g15765.t3.cds [Oikopleura dioica]
MIFHSLLPGLYSWLSLEGDLRWSALQFAILPFLFTLGYVSFFIMELAISPLDRQIQRLKIVGESYLELLTKINSEMTSGNKFESESGNVIVSPSFIVKLSPYSMKIIRKLDAQLNVLRVSEVPSTERGAEPETNMTVEATGLMTSHGQTSFNIFVRASDMDHLITYLGDDVEINTQNFEINTVWDRFRMAAKGIVDTNEKLEKRECDEEMEMCFACDMNRCDIRLASCACAAMWCFSCIVRVFASHQDAKRIPKTQWLSGSALCPHCTKEYNILGTRGSGLLKSIRRSFRKRKPKPPQLTADAQKPVEWQDDERKVNDGTCEFRVKYLGCAEVAEPRGIHHCEEAVKRHKLRRQRNKPRAVLVISPDAVRLIKEKSKQLILDQSIEKISFCAPDSTYEAAFSYICRDGATKRWMCYSFSSMTKEGERLSNAFGAAFRACYDKKKSLQLAENRIREETSFMSEQPVTTKAEIIVTKPESDPGYCEPPKSDNSESSKEESKKIKFEIKSLPRPQAPEELKRQPSFKLFVPSKNAFKTSSLREDKLQINVEKFRGHQVLNPVPELEPENTKPIQAVQPFRRNILQSQSMQVMRPAPKPIAQPIRESNPWSTQEEEKDKFHFESAFPAATREEAPSVTDDGQSEVGSTDCSGAGDRWIESISRDVIPLLKTGESGSSVGISTPRLSQRGKTPPVIPARSGFNRFNPAYASQRMPNSYSAPTGAFQRSYSVRYTGSAGMSSTSSSPNPFQDAPFPDFSSQWEALGQKRTPSSLNTKMGIKERRAKFQDKKSLVKPNSGKPKGKSKPFSKKFAGGKDQKSDSKFTQKRNDGKFKTKRQFPETNEDLEEASVKEEKDLKSEVKEEAKSESGKVYKVSISGLKSPSFAALRELTKKNNIVTDEFEINEDSVTIAYKAKKHALKACNVLCGLEYEGSSIHASLVGDNDAKKARRTRLIIRNLPWSCTEEKLKNVFHKFGAVTEVKIPLKADGKMRGFGFVQFTHGHESAKAVKAVREIDNRRVAVDWCLPREDYQAENKETSETTEPQEDNDSSDEEEEPTNDEDDENKIAPIGTMSSTEEEDSSDEEEEVIDEAPQNRVKTKPEKKQKKVEVDTSDVTEGRSVFLRNLPFDASMEDLEELVKPYGKAVKVSIVKNEVGVSKGVAFVEFETKDEADKVVVHTKELSLNGRAVFARTALPQSTVENMRKVKEIEKNAKNDKRNLALAKEGEIREGSKAWNKI